MTTRENDVRKIEIFDTTLRDGEQVPGNSLGIEAKLRIAHQFARLNVDVIEAGFPCSSPGDFEAVKRIAEEIEGPEICGLARAVKDDIVVCAKAIRGARKPRLHTFIGTSDVNIRRQLRKTPVEVLKIAVESVRLARSLCDVVEFSPMDATRTDLFYLYEVIEAVIDAGATIINIPDTVGYAMPEEFGSLIRSIFDRVPNIRQAKLSVHCHDDLGMAAANSLTAVTNGAQQIECTINGIGERAGNAALEEVVMALHAREAYFDGFRTDIRTEELVPTSRLICKEMGHSIPSNKAIVGSNAFAHSSGIHQDGVLKSRETFEIIQPEQVGAFESEIVLTARSGRRALRHRIEKLGYEVQDERLAELYERFLQIADRRKRVDDEELTQLAERMGLVLPQRPYGFPSSVNDRAIVHA